MVARWPERIAEEGWEAEAIKNFELVQEIVRSIRNLRSEYKIEPNKPLGAVIVSKTRSEFLQQEKHLLYDLGGLKQDEVEIVDSNLPNGDMTPLVVEDVEIYLDLADSGDSEVDRQRLEKELGEVESHIARLEKLLLSPFAQKAPEKVVEAEREKLAGYQSSAAKLRESLEK